MPRTDPFKGAALRCVHMLCGLLLTEEGLTIPDLMARYCVTRRTIYTDFDVLRAAGFTLDWYETGCERRKVWRIVT